MIKEICKFKTLKKNKIPVLVFLILDFVLSFYKTHIPQSIGSIVKQEIFFLIVIFIGFSIHDIIVFKRNQKDKQQ